MRVSFLFHFFTTSSKIIEKTQFFFNIVPVSELWKKTSDYFVAASFAIVGRGKKKKKMETLSFSIARKSPVRDKRRVRHQTFCENLPTEEEDERIVLVICIRCCYSNMKRVGGGTLSNGTTTTTATTSQHPQHTREYIWANKKARQERERVPCINKAAQLSNQRI